MLTKLDYYKLVLVGLESLEREIKDCREFTVSEYNAIIKSQEDAKAAQAQTFTQPTTPEKPKVTKTTVNKETK